MRSVREGRRVKERGKCELEEKAMPVLSAWRRFAAAQTVAERVRDGRPAAISGPARLGRLDGEVCARRSGRDDPASRGIS